MRSFPVNPVKDRKRGLILSVGSADVAHVKCRHGIKMMCRSHPAIRALTKADEAPSLHGTQIWRSSLLLMEYLAIHRLTAGQRVLEVGCGWGLLGIFCAKHFPVNVLLTDADPRVFPYAHEHADLNDVRVGTKAIRFDGISEGFLEDQDVILGADVCFWPELGTELRRLVERALSGSVTKILLADPGRPAFFRLAKACEHHVGAKLLRWPEKHRTKSSGYLLIIDRSPDA